MARLFIVVGDSLSGGGTVVSGSPFTDIDGSAMARVGDRVICKAHGPGTIVSGDTTLIIDGNPAARHGDKVSCGCQLIAGRQSLAFIEGGAAAAGTTPTSRPAPTTENRQSLSPHHRETLPPSRLSASGSAPGCWLEDHSKAISTEAYNRYFVIYDAEGNEFDTEIPAKFSIRIPLRSSGEMDVVVKFKVEPEDGLTTDDVSAVKERLQTAVDRYWNGKHTLAVADPRCGERRFPIRHKVEWVDAGHDYTMRIAARQGRENVEGLIVNVSKETTAWTMAHEYAHCIGLPDEYTDNELAHEVVRYYRHDGLLDETEIIAVYVRPASDPDATILSTVDHATIRLRHAWPIAIEAQEFLTAQLGRTIKCTVV